MKRSKQNPPDGRSKLLRRICFFIWLGAFPMGSLAQADFFWFNRATNRVTYAAGGTAYLAGNPTNAQHGCFIQLIYAGPDQTNSPAVATGTGVAGDDHVVAKGWAGKNIFSTNDVDGYLQGGQFTTNLLHGYYYVRAWTAPSPDYTNGIIPVNPTNFYGDSIVWRDPWNGPPEMAASFNFGGTTGFPTTARAQIVDTDHNGLPDWWEYLYFGVFTNTDLQGDPDDDLSPNGDEFLAGTEPTDENSVFQLNYIRGNPSQAVVRWPSVDGRRYALERGTNTPATGWAFSVIATNLPATPAFNSYTDTVSNAGALFYRVTVRPEE